jgi:glycosyltransferase involved in cell wall biosynthesis
MGGQAVQLARLYEALEQCPSLTLEFVPMNPRLPKALKFLQRVKYVRTLATLGWYLSALPSAILRSDVLHIFSPSYWAFLLGPLPALLLGRLLQRGTILDYHSGEAEDHLRRWPLSRRLLSELTDQITAPSQYLVEVFGKFGLKAIGIPNIVPSLDIRPRVTTSAFVVLSNRNLEPMYDVATVLRAFALIQAELPTATLIVAGEGSQRRALERLAESLQLANVQFLGRTEPAQMAELYRRATVYLNASRIDNQPLSLIEAMLARVPVVSTNAGGIPWMIQHGENGFLSACGDHVALAANALTVLRDPSVAEGLTRVAYERAFERHDSTRIVPYWTHLYRQVALRKPAALD